MAGKKKKKTTKDGEPAVAPWGSSKAKHILRQGIVDGSIPNSMPVEEVYELCDLFKLYNKENFTTNLKNLREAVAKDYDRMAADAKAYGHDIELLKILREQQPSSFPKPPYPNWHTHVARLHLRDDLGAHKHMSMTPKELYLTRQEYQEFPHDVFCDHIYQERDRISKQKA